MLSTENQDMENSISKNYFEKYVIQGDPEQKEKVYIWQTAIGIQDIDELKPSEFLIENAKQNIEGNITIEDVKSRLDSYYKQILDKNPHDRTEEADKVSAHIAEILSEKTFTFSPAEYINIHRRMFEGIFEFAGKIRDYNISKAEWVLNGEKVLYANTYNIRGILDFDFAQEKSFNYRGISMPDLVRHITMFTSKLWETHPFDEGNTRTTAVFIIKYLRIFGLDISNNMFAQNSLYFRNALVRANYKNLNNNIRTATEYLERFFRNLLLNENNSLINSELFIGVPNTNPSPKSAKKQDIQLPKSNICTLDCTLEELFILEFLKSNSKATQKDIAAHIRKSERTAKSRTNDLQEKKLLERQNGKRYGYWIVVEQELEVENTVEN